MQVISMTNGSNPQIISLSLLKTASNDVVTDIINLKNDVLRFKS